MAILKKITASETYSVRLPVLRKGKSVESCQFDGDHLATTIHFGLYLNQELVGIVSLFQKSNPLFPEKKQFQIRGMAVLDDFQKKGIGEKLVQTVINFAKEKEVKVIWFNARKNAVPFYEKLDFHIHGTAFEIEGIGTHYVMYQLL